VPEPPEERETLDGLSERVSPLGEPAADRLIVPEKLLRLVRPIVEVEEDPAFMLTDDGLAEMLKSGEGEVGLRNSVIGFALPSPVLRLAKFQFASIVLVKE
jgi:hypothetical protein